MCYRLLIKHIFLSCHRMLKNTKLTNTNQTHPALLTMHKRKGRAAGVQHRNHEIYGIAYGIAQASVVCVRYYINHRLPVKYWDTYCLLLLIMYQYIQQCWVFNHSYTAKEGRHIFRLTTTASTLGIHTNTVVEYVTKLRPRRMVGNTRYVGQYPCHRWVDNLGRTLLITLIGFLTTIWRKLFIRYLQDKKLTIWYWKQSYLFSDLVLDLS